MIDLRSDTVTRPTEKMREAMYKAEVGDDVFGDDPTVNRLQETVAGLLGKEAALYVPSGTMANQVAIKSHTQPGDEVIAEVNCHVFNYESGAPAMLSGVQVHTLPGNYGVYTAEQMQAAIRGPDHHLPPTRLALIENTHNRAGGTIFPVDEMKRIRSVADQHGIAIHLDGARLWNASAATGLDLRAWADLADSVSVCFSKGLGAPVGSMIAGSKVFIDRAHRFRKVFGGGMRQAGIIAAAALYAVQNHRSRLVEDHQNCRLLAETFAELPGVILDLNYVQTNILIVEFNDKAPYDGPGFAAAMKEIDVWLLPTAPRKVRLVTHLDVSRQDVDEACGKIREVWKQEL
ncbi:MAG: low-specificity L-threonine aldolase [bacterium]|nr:low-specificity L-threonine aldolase [bacterium]